MWVVSVHWKGLLWSQLWANPASLPFQPTQREQRGGGKLHTNLLTIPILISEPSCNQLTPKHTTTRPSYLLLFFTLTCYFSFPLLWKPVCLHAVCSKLILFSVIKNDVVTSPAQWAFSRHLCYYQLFSVHERRNNPDTADLWLSCTPLRLVMVSSRFCRRSRTFCTVLFLWDSGSAGGTHTWVILTTKNCHAAT